MTTEPFLVSSEADVLALIPLTFGFHPEDSLVLVTVAAGNRPFHARVDLPPDPGELPCAVDPLVRAAVRNGASRALVVVAIADRPPNFSAPSEGRLTRPRWFVPPSPPGSGLPRHSG